MRILLPTTACGLLALSLACGGGGGSTAVPTLPPAAPSGLSYPSQPIVAIQGTALSPLTPTVTGQATQWSVAPALPGGLNLGTTTGILSGTATAPTSYVSSYVVTASNAGGSTTATLKLAVNPPVAGTWTAAANMGASRGDGSACLLADGRVLVAGGFPGDVQNRAELYDPATNAWSYTGALPAQSWSGTAVTLASGKVLYVGGTNMTAALATAYLFDPSAGTWTATGSMQQARWGLMAVVLPSGKVLAMGGRDSSGTYFNTAELYNPATGTWSSAGSFTTPVAWAGVALLSNGKVLLAGGYPDSSTCSLYDPATNQWTATGTMARSRYLFNLALLPSGKVLAAGGSSSDGLCEVYDPSAGSWSAAGTTPDLPQYGSSALVPLQGKVIRFAGAQSGAAYLGCSAFDPSTLSWTATGSLVHPAANSQTWVLLANGKLLLCGGRIEPSSGGALNMTNFAQIYW